MHKLTLPTLDENVTEYTIGRWLKNIGDEVAVSEPLLEVETDKVTMEIVSEWNGRLSQQLASEGDVLKPGAELGTIEPQNVPVPVNGSKTISPKNRTPVSPKKETRLTPVVARMVAEHNLDVSVIPGSGKNGRVTKKDVMAFLRDQRSGIRDQKLGAEGLGLGARKSQTQNGDMDSHQPFQGAGSIDQQDIAERFVASRPLAPSQKVPLSGMRRSIAEHMVRSLQTSPHVTTLFEFDFHKVAAHRKANKAQFAKEGIKLTYMAYLALATVEALKLFPLVNSEYHDDGIELKTEINLGMITAVPDGLYNPVIHHADGYNLRGMARKIGELAEKSRQGQLKQADLQHGTFTISNHGAAGSLAGTPIIFQPQAGILGVGKIEERVQGD